MRSNIQVVVVDKSERFKTSNVFSLDNARNRIGSYSEDKIEKFKKRFLNFLGNINVVVREFGNKAYDAYVDFDIAVNDAIDGFADKILDHYDGLEEKDVKEQSVRREDISSFDKLQSMMSDEELKRLGFDIENEESITELQELKKELLMGNYQVLEGETKDTVRRGSRGVLYVWMTILVSVLFMSGIFIAVTILK